MSFSENILRPFLPRISDHRFLQLMRVVIVGCGFGGLEAVDEVTERLLEHQRVGLGPYGAVADQPIDATAKPAFGRVIVR